MQSVIQLLQCSNSTANVQTNASLHTAAEQNGQASSQLLACISNTLKRSVERQSNISSGNEAGSAHGSSSSPAADSCRPTVFHGARAPGISIEDYVTRIAKHTRASAAAFLTAMHYIYTICQADTQVELSMLTVHRLLLTSVLVAAKLHDDDIYNNTFYARVGGTQAEELLRLECELLRRLNHKLLISHEQLEHLLNDMIEGRLIITASAST